jgi:hypothetical protein
VKSGNIYFMREKIGLSLHVKSVEKLKEFKPSGMTWDYFLLELLKAWLAKGQ